MCKVAMEVEYLNKLKIVLLIFEIIENHEMELICLVCFAEFQTVRLIWGMDLDCMAC